MHVGLVTQWYPPENPALAARSMAASLTAGGHSVDVVTGVPNYPTGRVYPGYKVELYRRDIIDGVRIHRGPLYPSHDNSAVKRIGNYLSFAAGSIPTSYRFGEPDVWLTNSTPATVAAAGIIHKLQRKTPHAMVIQDLWPDSVTGSGFVSSNTGRVMETALHRFCNFTYKHTDLIGIISPGMKTVLCDRGVPEENIRFMPNVVSDTHILPHLKSDKSSLREQLGLPNGFIFMYAGNFGKLQNLLGLVSAFTLVPDAHLVLVGSGVMERDLQELSKTVRNIHLIERQPLSEIGKYLVASDVQVVSLQDTPLLQVTMPSKVQSALAAGKPVLAHAAGDAARVVTDSDVGLGADPNDPGRAAESIRMLMRMPSATIDRLGENARSLYLAMYSPAAGVERMNKFLADVVERKPLS